MKPFFILMLATGLLTYSCKKETPMRTNLVNGPVQDTVANTTTIPADSNTVALKYYLALGDSYTIGQSVNPAERYPKITVDNLNALSLHFAGPEIIAQTGWTTGNLINRLATSTPLRKYYDIVSLLIGVNNQYQGLSQNQYKTEFTFLLNTAIKLAGDNPKHVFVLSIPDYSVTPFATGSNKEAIARQINEFNTINSLAAKSAGVHYLEITSSTRQAATDPSLIATDGLHPSGKEYYKWAQSLAPLIKAAL